MTFALMPISLKHAAVCPVVNAVASLFVIYIFAFENNSIIEGLNAVAMHIIVLPLAQVLHSSIFPRIFSIAVDFVVRPITSISDLHAFIIKAFISALALFNAINEYSLKFNRSPIHSPRFWAKTVLFVIKKQADIY